MDFNSITFHFVLNLLPFKSPFRICFRSFRVKLKLILLFCLFQQLVHNLHIEPWQSIEMK